MCCCGGRRGQSNDGSDSNEIAEVETRVKLGEKISKKNKKERVKELKTVIKTEEMMNEQRKEEKFHDRGSGIINEGFNQVLEDHTSENNDTDLGGFSYYADEELLEDCQSLQDEELPKSDNVFEKVNSIYDYVDHAIAWYSCLDNSEMDDAIWTEDFLKGLSNVDIKPRREYSVLSNWRNWSSYDFEAELKVCDGNATILSGVSVEKNWQKSTDIGVVRNRIAVQQIRSEPIPKVLQTVKRANQSDLVQIVTSSSPTSDLEDKIHLSPSPKIIHPGIEMSFLSISSELTVKVDLASGSGQQHVFKTEKPESPSSTLGLASLRNENSNILSTIQNEVPLTLCKIYVKTKCRNRPKDQRPTLVARRRIGLDASLSLTLVSTERRTQMDRKIRIGFGMENL